MTDIRDDERAMALQWLEDRLNEPNAPHSRKMARAILALLERRAVPHDAADIPDDIIDRMVSDYASSSGSTRGKMRYALNGLIDHYAKPAEPVEAWELRTETYGRIRVFDTLCQAQAAQRSFPGSRIVHLREVRDE